MMAYYNGFPATYTPYTTAYDPIRSNTTAYDRTQSGINWIQGEQAAKSYLVAPNSTVVLFDTESQTVYIKSADATGMPNMKTLDYTVRESNKNPSIPASDVKNDNSPVYATKDEINAVSEQITALRSKVAKLTKKLEEVDDE